MDNLLIEQQTDVVGHRFLDTIDLDIMEQTIIDTVVAEISSEEHAVVFEPILSRSFSEPVLKGGIIEAFDAEGLLEQFEEASQSLENQGRQVLDSAKTDVPVFTLYPDADQEEESKDRNGNIEKKELTKEVLEKLKTCAKSKSAVMLPMMVPAKRGRGRAMTRGHPVALPANCTPRRLQRVMMQNERLKGSIAMEQPINDSVNDIAKVSEVDANRKVSEVPDTGPDAETEQFADQNHFDHILDHDYSKTAEKDVSKSVERDEISMNKSYSESDLVQDIEEGEIIEKEIMSSTPKGFKGSRSREDLIVDHSNLFDKLPSYYTALSIPRKQFQKTASCVTGRGGMTVHDFIERDSSPIRDTSYSKLPDYCSSFTNSTRYDSLSESGKKCVVSEGSKASSGYSSLNHSPDMLARMERSRSRSYSDSRSRSRSKSLQRSSRQPRQSSYSSYSGYSSSGSSCSRSICSDSSCCRSRSGSCDSARSVSCSTCRSRSASASCERSVSWSRSRSHRRSRSASCNMSSSSERSASRSLERSWKREHRMRGDRRRHSSHSSVASQRARSRSRRSRRQRSRSYCYSRSRSRGYRSRSRSVSRDRRPARTESRERRKYERQKQREEEKEQQMKERRIVYVGGLPNNYTRNKLKENFSRFGPIEHVQLHFREHGDNYGFVTFTYTCDAFAAIEKGNKVPALEKFDLCFGGRRQFCDVEYADLDGNKEVEEEYDSKPQRGNALDFDELLRMAKAGLKKS